MCAEETMTGSAPVKSMTGFGRARRLDNGVEVTAEVRCVNHRFLDVFVRAPKVYVSLEPQIRKLVSNAVHRGKVDVTISRTGGTGKIMDVVVDFDLAERYHAQLVEVSERLGLTGDISLSDMLTLSDIVTPMEREAGVEEEWPLVEGCLVEALQAVDSMRITEGAAMWKDITERLSEVGRLADRISPLVDQVTAAVKERLERRVAELTGGLDLDRERLTQEVALMADRADVTEELTRLASHVKQFLAFGNQGSPLGRKLDFLLQELHREINTIGSKSASTEIATCVVRMKAELEKIREQTQNLE